MSVRLGAALVGFALAGLGLDTVHAESFTVNAQYRGVVKKAFSNLGTSELNFTPGAGGTFRVTGAARVEHPKEEGRVFDMKYDMTFKLTGNQLQQISNRNTSNPGSEEALKVTEKLLPFLHVMKNVPLTGAKSMSFSSPHGQYTLSFNRAPSNLEATLNEGGRMVGKFFLPPDADAPPRRIEKFRVTTRTGTVLSFVAGGGQAISRAEE